MRGAFFRELKQTMIQDESVFLLAADMGLGLVEEFENDFPKRFLNVGIAEQNMIGVAAGLCNIGFRPFCYTISNFLVQRCFEQIRNDICLHDYPVTLVGTSTGFDNGILGATHQAIDDIGSMRVFPNMAIYSPATVDAMPQVFSEIFHAKRPTYLRLGKGSFHTEEIPKAINQMIYRGSDNKVLVITHGNILENCVKAYKSNPQFSLYCMNRIRPLDEEGLVQCIREFQHVVIVEDQFKSAGLYGLLAQFLFENGLANIKLHSISPTEKYEKIVGDSQFFADLYGYSPEKLSVFISTLTERSD